MTNIGDDKLMQQMNEENFGNKLWRVWIILWIVAGLAVLWMCASVAVVLEVL